MSSQRDKGSDRQRTAALLLEVMNGAEPPAELPNWLGHTEGAACIDAELLWGSTMPRLELCRGAVQEHFRHLRVEHGLTVDDRNDVYRLAVRQPAP